MRCLLPTALTFCVLAACGPGKYGYARTYEPLKAEADLYERAATPPHEQVVRDPVRYAEELIAWFGIVEGMEKLPDGRVRLTLSLRRHQERHLCSERSDSSCRVTVSKRPMGTFQFVTTLEGDEADGKNRVWAGSLMLVYGSVDLEAEMDDVEVPMLKVRYYRHWPRGTYVTTAARATMRR